MLAVGVSVASFFKYLKNSRKKKRERHSENSQAARILSEVIYFNDLLNLPAKRQANYHM